MPQEKPKNPLELLFNEYLDDSILNDPKKLAEMVRRQKRMLMSAFHPDQYNPQVNPNGAFEYKDAEARFKRVNIEAIDLLVRALDLATGKTPEKYAGEAKQASEVLGYWIKDYQSRQGSNGELHQLNESLLRQVTSLGEELNRSKRYAKSLEERLRGAGRTDSSYGAGPSADISDKLKGITEKLDSANYWAKEGDYSTMSSQIRGARQGAEEQGVNFDRMFGSKVTEVVSSYIENKLGTANYWAKEGDYSVMSRNIQEAKKGAKEHGVDFERAFGRNVNEIVGVYIEYELSSADYWRSELNEEAFIRRIDNAVKAATDFGKTTLFKRQIEEAVREFIDAAIERGKDPDWKSSATRYFDMARRVGVKYNIR